MENYKMDRGGDRKIFIVKETNRKRQIYNNIRHIKKGTKRKDKDRKRPISNETHRK